MGGDKKVSTQRIQLARHTFSYFFPYYWISLIASLFLYTYLTARYGIQFRPPRDDPSSYIEYTSQHATIAAAWIAITGLSVREQKATSIISSYLSRKIPSLCIALILAFNSSLLLMVNYAWLTMHDSTITISIKLTSGVVGLGFSLTAIVGPYLFVLLAQGNPDTKTLENRDKYLTTEEEYLQKLVNNATGYENQEERFSKIFRRINYFILTIFLICVFCSTTLSPPHNGLPIRRFIFISVMIVLTSLTFFLVFLSTSWVWKQLWVQKTVDLKGETLREIIVMKPLRWLHKQLFRFCMYRRLCSLLRWLRSLLQRRETDKKPTQEGRNQEDNKTTGDPADPESEKRISTTGPLHWISAFFTFITLFALLFFALITLFFIGKAVFWDVILEIPNIEKCVNEGSCSKLGIAFPCGILSLALTITMADAYARIRRKPTPIQFMRWWKISISQVASKGIDANERDRDVVNALLRAPKNPSTATSNNPSGDNGTQYRRSRRAQRRRRSRLR